MLPLILLASLVGQADSPPAPGRQLLPAVVEGRSVRLWGWPVRYPDGSTAVGYWPAENPHLTARPEPAEARNYGVSLPHALRESIRTNDREFGESVANDLAAPSPGGLFNRKKPPKPCPGPGPCPPDGDEPPDDQEPAQATNYGPYVLAIMGALFALVGVVLIAVACLIYVRSNPQPARPAHVHG